MDGQGDDRGSELDLLARWDNKDAHLCRAGCECCWQFGEWAGDGLHRSVVVVCEWRDSDRRRAGRSGSGCSARASVRSRAITAPLLPRLWIPKQMRPDPHPGALEPALSFSFLTCLSRPPDDEHLRPPSRADWAPRVLVGAPYPIPSLILPASPAPHSPAFSSRPPTSTRRHHPAPAPAPASTRISNRPDAHDGLPVRSRPRAVLVAAAQDRRAAPSPSRLVRARLLGLGVGLGVVVAVVVALLCVHPPKSSERPARAKL